MQLFVLTIFLPTYIYVFSLFCISNIVYLILPRKIKQYSEIQSIIVPNGGHVSEIHKIKTIGASFPSSEVQIFHLGTIDDRNDVQKITTGLDMTNFVTIKVGYSLNKIDPIVTRISTSIDHMGSLTGFFEIYLNQNGSHVSSGPLDFNISSSALQKSINNLCETKVNVSDIGIRSNGTKEWTILSPYLMDKFVFGVNGNGLLGKGASIHFVTDDSQFSSTESINGFFELLFRNFDQGIKKSNIIPITASEKEVKHVLEGVSVVSAGSVTVIKRFLDNKNELLGHFFVLKFLPIYQYDSNTHSQSSPLVELRDYVHGRTERVSLLVRQNTNKLEIQVIEIDSNINDDVSCQMEVSNYTS